MNIFSVLPLLQTVLNHCVTGICEIILNDENFVYVKTGEISLTERFARKQSFYPCRIYEGMEFFIDLDTQTAQSNLLYLRWNTDAQKIWKTSKLKTGFTAYQSHPAWRAAVPIPQHAAPVSL